MFCSLMLEIFIICEDHVTRMTKNTICGLRRDDWEIEWVQCPGRVEANTLAGLMHIHTLCGDFAAPSLQSVRNFNTPF
jgi:hypothetical protein